MAISSFTRGATSSSPAATFLAGFSARLNNFQPVGVRSRLPRPSGSVVVHAKKRSPVHLKYVKKTREQLEKEYLEEWMETTAVDGSAQQPMTAWTILGFVPMWLRFCIIPEPIRYIFSLVWQVIEPTVKSLNCQCLLLGAKLDAGLSQSPKGRFSTGEVLRRLHGKTSILRKITYRFGLMMGKTLAELSRESESLVANPKPIQREIAAADVISPA